MRIKLRQPCPSAARFADAKGSEFYLSVLGDSRQVQALHEVTLIWGSPLRGLCAWPPEKLARPYSRGLKIFLLSHFVSITSICNVSYVESSRHLLIHFIHFIH